MEYINGVDKLQTYRRSDVANVALVSSVSLNTLFNLINEKKDISKPDMHLDWTNTNSVRLEWQSAC